MRTRDVPCPRPQEKPIEPAFLFPLPSFSDAIRVVTAARWSGSVACRKPSARLTRSTTAGCGDIDPCRSPCTCERLSTPSTEGYARIMLRGSTTLKTAATHRAVGPCKKASSQPSIVAIPSPFAKTGSPQPASIIQRLVYACAANLDHKRYKSRLVSTLRHCALRL